MTELKEQYEQELSEQFDWEGLKQDIVQNAIETLHDFTLDELRLHDLTDGEAIVGQAYIGTVFALIPSGKYYMPWACSNVEACPECDGDGHARDACEYDPHKCHGLACEDCPSESKRRDDSPITENCQYCNGLGARNIRALAELRNESIQATVRFLHDNDYTFLDARAYQCNVCRGTGKQFVTCPTCNGMGSAEAYQDSLWYEALESVAGDHDMWYTAGEGSATDIMVGKWVSFNEIVRYVLDEHVALVRAWLDGDATIRNVRNGLRVAKSLVNKINQIEKGE
jgi:hypothetical protein